MKTKKVKRKNGADGKQKYDKKLKTQNKEHKYLINKVKIVQFPELGKIFTFISLTPPHLLRSSP